MLIYICKLYKHKKKYKLGTTKVLLKRNMYKKYK